MTVYGGEIDESLPEIPNPDYPSPAVKAVYEFLWDSVPACQGYRLTNEFRNGFKEESDPYDMLAGAAALTLISTRCRSCHLPAEGCKIRPWNGFAAVR